MTLPEKTVVVPTLISMVSALVREVKLFGSSALPLGLMIFCAEPDNVGVTELVLKVSMVGMSGRAVLMSNL